MTNFIIGIIVGLLISIILLIVKMTIEEVMFGRFIQNVAEIQKQSEKIKEDGDIEIL